MQDLLFYREKCPVSTSNMDLKIVSDHEFSRLYVKWTNRFLYAILDPMTPPCQNQTYVHIFFPFKCSSLSLSLSLFSLLGQQTSHFIRIHQPVSKVTSVWEQRKGESSPPTLLQEPKSSSKRESKADGRLDHPISGSHPLSEPQCHKIASPSSVSLHERKSSASWIPELSVAASSRLTPSVGFCFLQRLEDNFRVHFYHHSLFPQLC